MVDTGKPAAPANGEQAPNAAAQEPGQDPNAVQDQNPGQDPGQDPNAASPDGSDILDNATDKGAGNPEGDPSGDETNGDPGEENARVVPKADGYTLPEGTPEVIGTFASENDFTQAQLDSTLAFFGQVTQASALESKKAILAEGKALLDSWGDSAKYNTNIAKTALAQNDPKGELTALLKESGYSNHPAVIRFMHGVGMSMQEGGFLKSSITRPPGKKTAAQKMYGDNHPSSTD